MRELSTADTLTYIKHAIDLETEVVAQNGIISAYDVSANKRRPVLIEETPHHRPYAKRPAACDDEYGMWALLGGFLLILGIAALFLCTLDVFMGLLFALPFLIPGILMIKRVITNLRCKKEYEAACYEIDWLNKQEDQRIQQLNDENAVTYRKQCREWSASNDDVHAYMNVHLEEIRSALSEFYAADVIYPKYRTLPALTSIYEYLVTGRCDTLTGPHGAYNLYEDELRKDTVISQLNTVIENLEQIKQNQYMLYEQVKGIQQNTALVIAELEQIRGYTIATAELTALNAYYNRVNASISAAQLYCIS